MGLFTIAALWYGSFYKLLFSGKNGLDAIPTGWLILVAFGPTLSAVLGIALDRKLKIEDRGMRFWEILLVVFVMPQFFGVVYVWLGLFHYM